MMKVNATINKKDAIIATSRVALAAVALATAFLCSSASIFSFMILKINRRISARKEACFTELFARSFNCSYFDRRESVASCSPGSVILCSCLIRLVSMVLIWVGFNSPEFSSITTPILRM